MSKIIFITFLFFTSLTGFSQVTVNGEVKDESGMPVPGANVVIEGTTSGATTDFDGNFTFTTSESGAQTLKVTYVGFQTFTKDINLDNDVTTEVILKEDSQQLNEVLVTATSTRRSQKETPMSITSVGAKELAEKNTSSQADILRSVPGITAEGSGGEVASNIFVRGLPSGGQYQFNPLQIDGMPVLSTFGLNSSAHDVYFRNDLGMRNLEFVRGGASILYGVGSVAGIINYNSFTGGPRPETVIRTEVATNSRFKADFRTSGQLGGEDSKTFYMLTGFHRYDDGPIKTGLPTRGFQLRGNLKHETKNGSITFHGQFIDDRVQFYLPFPLEGGSRERPTGNDGSTIYTLQTADAKNLSYRTPNGIYETPIEDGVRTKGGYFMTEFKHNFENDVKMDAKLRYSNYAHQFNFFLDGSGVSGAKAVETQQEYLDARGLGGGDFTYLNGEALPEDYLLFENRILDRDRPLQEMMADVKFTKSVGVHNITAGTFMSRSDSEDFNVTTSYLSEYSDQPRLVNLSGYTQNGLTNAAIGYTNRNVTSNKIAVFLTDEIKLDRWNFDIGVRYERASGVVENEGTSSYNVDDTGIENIDNVVWGNGNYTTGEVDADDFAVALAALYKVNDDMSVYGNFSKGYFFPELRGMQFDSFGNPATYDTEQIIQSEIGLKYGTPKLSGTVAIYNVNLTDRRAITFVNTPDGGLIEEVDVQDTKTLGAEITWGWNVIENFRFGGSFTYQDHEISKSESDPEFEGNEMRRQPKMLGTLDLNYDNSKLDAGFMYNYLGDKYANDANTIKLDGYGLASLNTGYTFSVGDDLETLRLGVRVFNVFNSQGVTEGSPRLGNNQTDEEFFVGRPVLPTRAFLSATFSF